MFSYIFAYPISTVDQSQSRQMLMGQLTPFRPYQVLLVCELQLWGLRYFFVVVSYPCYRVMYLFLPVVWCNAIMFLWVSIPWKSDFLQKEQAHQDIQGCPKSLGFSKKKSGWSCNQIYDSWQFFRGRTQWLSSLRMTRICAFNKQNAAHGCPACSQSLCKASLMCI